MTTATPVDEARLEAFVGQTVSEFSAAFSSIMALLGDRLGLYRALAGAGPVTSAELASRAGIAERYAREWLANQAAGGILEYDAAAGTFTLPAEHALVYADDSSPVFLLGGLDILESLFHDVGRFTEAFRSGDGVAWGDHHCSLFSGTERFFRTGYRAALTAAWIPALDGVEARLQQGGRIADLGCGHGASSVVIAEAYPQVTVVGSDAHDASIDQARARAADAGVADRVTFEVARAQEFDGGPYDLVCMCDCLHDMGDPVGAARRIHEQLAPGGTWLLVEPFAHDTLQENLNPVGRMFYAASTLVCCPNAMAQDGGHALGAQAGEARLRAIAEEAGFTHFRRATETPFNLVFEIRR